MTRGVVQSVESGRLEGFRAAPAAGGSVQEGSVHEEHATPECVHHAWTLAATLEHVQWRVTLQAVGGAGDASAAAAVADSTEADVDGVHRLGSTSGQAALASHYHGVIGTLVRAIRKKNDEMLAATGNPLGLRQTMPLDLGRLGDAITSWHSLSSTARASSSSPPMPPLPLPPPPPPPPQAVFDIDDEMDEEASATPAARFAPAAAPAATAAPAAPAAQAAQAAVLAALAPAPSASAAAVAAASSFANALTSQRSECARAIVEAHQSQSRLLSFECVIGSLSRLFRVDVRVMCQCAAMALLSKGEFQAQQARELAEQRAAAAEAKRLRDAEEHARRVREAQEKLAAAAEEELWNGKGDCVSTRLLKPSTGCARDGVPTLGGLALLAVARGMGPPFAVPESDVVRAALVTRALASTASGVHRERPLPAARDVVENVRSHVGRLLSWRAEIERQREEGRAREQAEREEKRLARERAKKEAEEREAARWSHLVDAANALHTAHAASASPPSTNPPASGDSGQAPSAQATHHAASLGTEPSAASDDSTILPPSAPPSVLPSAPSSAPPSAPPEHMAPLAGASSASARYATMALAYGDPSLRSIQRCIDDMIGQLDARARRMQHAAAQEAMTAEHQCASVLRSVLDRVVRMNDARHVEPPKEYYDATVAELGNYLVLCGGQPGLVAGWSARSETRMTGNSAGTTDLYYFSTRGKKFRSAKEVARHFGLDTSTATKPTVRKWVPTEPSAAVAPAAAAPAVSAITPLAPSEADRLHAKYGTISARLPARPAPPPAPPLPPGATAVAAATPTDTAMVPSACAPHATAAPARAAEVLNGAPAPSNDPQAHVRPNASPSGPVPPSRAVQLAAAASSAAPSLTLRIAVEAPRCPSGHALSHAAAGDALHCDGCHASLGADDERFSCVQCDFDLCDR